MYLISLCLSFIRTLVIGFRAHSDYPGKSFLKILNLTSTKNLLGDIYCDCRLNFSPSSNSYIDILSPNVMVFGSGVFRKYLGLDEIMGWALHYRISAPIKRDTRACSPFLSLSLPCEDTSRRQLSASQRVSFPGTESAGICFWNFQPPRLWKNKCLCFKPSNGWYFVMSSLDDKVNSVQQLGISFGGPLFNPVQLGITENISFWLYFHFHSPRLK